MINNAVKFSDRGMIRVTTTRAGNSVRVDIDDQGIGIADSDIPKLFQSFTQIPSSVPRRRRSHGTGLGLAIARRSIESHQGSIGVRSTLGVGSTFYFTLPLDTGRQLASPMLRSMRP